MSDTISESKRKRKNRTRIFVLVMIYFMILGTAVGVTAANGQNINTVAAISIIAAISVIYWAGFYIVIRRENQKGN